ncbi:hypothetical protein ONZ45_g14538 [Pleurotus djamor]|nr:hypothetical protein ONZ45_g14538 [Pleurotus djamor]
MGSSKLLRVTANSASWVVTAVLTETVHVSLARPALRRTPTTVPNANPYQHQPTRALSAQKGASPTVVHVLRVPRPANLAVAQPRMTVSCARLVVSLSTEAVFERMGMVLPGEMLLMQYSQL